MRWSRRSLATLSALALLTLVLSAPLHAGTRPAASRGAATPARSTIQEAAKAWYRLWQRIAALGFKSGSVIDPNGQNPPPPPPPGSGG